MITNYVIQFSSDNGGNWTTFYRAASTATSATVIGLTNGTSYLFRVAAVNGAGIGAFSGQSAPVVVAMGKGMPITLASFANQRLQTIGPGAVPQLPEGDVTLGGVRFSIPVGGNNVWTGAVAVGVNPRVITVPVNIFGVAQVHTLINTLWGEQDAGTRASISFHGNASAVYTVLLDGNADIRDYLWNTFTNTINGTTTINVFTAGVGQGFGPGNQVRLDMQTFKLPEVFASQTLTSIRISDWGENQYQRLIVSGISVISADAPAAPTNVTATAGSAQASLTWTAPSSNGGATITDYVVQYSSNSGSTWTTVNRVASTTTSATVTGLTNGTSYIFRVAAVNSAGTGSYSANSESVTPRSVGRPAVDFNGNGIPDLIWQSTDGVATVWLDGNQSTSRILGGGGGWSLAATGDFNGDGVSDLVWRSPNGIFIVWLMRANGTSASQRHLGGDGAWEIEATGDYDGDGKTDLIWRNTFGGANVMWLMNGDGPSQQTPIGGSLDWRLVSTMEQFDVNGDGRTDLIWRQSASGVNVLWRMSGSSVVSAVPLGGDRNWRIVGTGDFNGDGAGDVLWRHATTGTVVMHLFEDGFVVTASVIARDSSRTVVDTMDADGDGVSDIFWRTLATGETERWLMDGLAARSKTPIGGNTTWRLLGRPGNRIA
jgi:hypothetical protein